MEGKRGEMHISMIITIIILVAGFALLLFVYYQISWTGTIDREVCHRSIIYRGTLPSETKEYVPLTCPTAKICITGKFIGKGDCQEFKNEKGIVTIRVNDGEKGLEEIQRAYAQEIVSCWEMVGQGRLSLYSNFLAVNYGLGDIAPSCIICSRIAVDKSSFNSIDFSKMDLNNYMNEHLVPGKQKTYFQYMTGDENAAPVMLGDSLTIGKISNSGGEIDGGQIKINNGEKALSNDGNSIPETAILFSQISAPDPKSVFRNDILTILSPAAVVGSQVIIAKSTIPEILVKKVGAPVATRAGGIVALIITGLIGGYQAYSVSSNRALAAKYCGDMSVGSQAYSGCSVLRTVNYDAENILKYCTYIESIP